MSDWLEAGRSEWTRSLIEEVIGCLWLIAAVLAFGFKFDTVGWLLAIKAATDQGSAIWFAVKEAIAEKKASNNGSVGPEADRLTVPHD